MANQPLIILGSARRQSETQQGINLLFKDQNYTMVNLLDYPVAPFRYSHDYAASDKFLEIINLVLQHDKIVFATPVYWYAMSGLLKTFFDRFTDLVTIRKDLGRKLKGRQLFLLAVGADEEIPPGFTIPFKLTADYLKMHFAGYIYIPTKNINANFSEEADSKAFLQKILNQQP